MITRIKDVKIDKASGEEDAGDGEDKLDWRDAQDAVQDKDNDEEELLWSQRVDSRRKNQIKPEQEPKTSTQPEDGNGTKSDFDGESDDEELSEDEESNEHRSKIMEEAIAAHAARLYSNLVTNKGKKYADKFKNNLKDIAKEQILETLEERKKERLQRQIE